MNFSADPALMYRYRRFLPLAASGLLVAWLLWRISPAEVARAFGQLDWPRLLPLSALLVLAAYLWDSLCFLCLFSDARRPLSYRQVLRARGASYFFAVFNFALGQGQLAWALAKLRDQSLLSGLGRFLILVYVDLFALLGLGLLGAGLSDHGRARGIMIFCAAGLTGLVLATAAVRWVPEGQLERLRNRPWGAWLPPREWDGRRLAALLVLRIAYFSIGMAYAVAGLWLIGLEVDRMLVLGAVPIMALVDGLPISVSGLGTRETTLLFLLQPDQPALLLAFCLLWSTCVILGRGLIGLIHVWFLRPVEAVSR